MQERKWIGQAPIKCDIQNCQISDNFVDGRLRQGSWAIMCLECHKNHGVGLGTGKGQKYTRTGNEFIKVEG